MKNDKIIAIVDYGLGNLYSLTKAVKFFTPNVIITDNSDIIKKASAIILPGVGAFAAGMQGLKKRNLIDPIKNFAKSGKPMLGICLGAQLMLSKGFEFGEHDGLAIIPGIVEIFPESVANKNKIPHIGWNQIYPPKNVKWKEGLFYKDLDQANVYFVHSYIMTPDNPNNIIALTEYGGLKFCAATKKDNIYGTQFHPEKSGPIGLTILENFIKIV